MYKIGFYVPKSHLESVKNAMFANGGGKYARYECCAWQVEGTGQFRPLKEAMPFVGKVGDLEIVAEYRVEMVCTDSCINEVITALLQAHPYEEPAYDVVEMKQFEREL